MLYNSRGGSRITTLVYLLIGVLVIYVAIKVVPPYRTYYAMEDEVNQQMQLAEINSEDVILNDIFLKAQDLELPINREDISVVKNENGGMEVSMHWEYVVDFGYGIKRSFPFDISVNKRVAQNQ